MTTKNSCFLMIMAIVVLVNLIMAREGVKAMVLLDHQIPHLLRD